MSHREYLCYSRRQNGESWHKIGARYWGAETPPRDWHGPAGPWLALKASCAASRYARRAGAPWPIRRGGEE